MPEIPEQAVQLVAERMLRRYESEHEASHLTWLDFADDARSDLEAAVPLLAGPVVTEYASDMGSGWHLWDAGPYMERFAQLAERIEAARANGFRVRRRTVIVVEDWEEVPREP